MSMPTYDTVQDAIVAGYRRVNVLAGDTDVSGANAYGKQYQDVDGRLSVSVYITTMRNSLGQPGAYIEMIQPE